jgi:hypothetical protein
MAAPHRPPGPGHRPASTGRPPHQLRTIALATAGVVVLLAGATWFAWPTGAGPAPAAAADANSAGSRPTGTASGSPTASTSPVPSPTVAAPTTRAPVVPKPMTGGKPGPGNTGVPKGTALTTVTGNQVYRTAGQVVSGLDIHGFVSITAKNVTIKNSIIRGGPNPHCNSAVLDMADSASATVMDTEIMASTPSPCLDGIFATNATLLRLNVHGGTDGMKAFDNVTLQDSWIHDMDYNAHDPNQNGGPTHNDAIQTYEGNQHITIKHNTLTPGDNANAAYQVGQDGGKIVTDLHIDSNWLDDGGCTLNFAHQGGPTPMTGIYVTNNRFGRNSFYDCPILVSTQTVLSQNTGNVWDDTGKPIPPVQRHD